MSKRHAALVSPSEIDRLAIENKTLKDSLAVILQWSGENFVFCDGLWYDPYDDMRSEGRSTAELIDLFMDEGEGTDGEIEDAHIFNL